MLMTASFSTTVQLSLKSLDRYQTKSTVVTIERDHYYWNTSLPSFTICPAKRRIDRDLFDRYCEQHRITGTAKNEFYEFIESLANASYESFDLIKHYDSVDVNDFSYQNPRRIDILCGFISENKYRTQRLHDADLQFNKRPIAWQR